MHSILAIALVLLLASCSQGEAPAPVTPEKGISPAASPMQVPAERSPRPAAVEYAPLSFDIARYPGARQIGDAPDFSADDHQQRKARWLQFESVDPPEKVIAFYKAEADKAGFTITEETEKKLVQSRQIKAERPQGGLLRVNTMVQEDGNTFINVHTSEDI